MSFHYQKAYFLLSAPDCKQLPEDTGIEVAIVGRSNAGKSSVLNRITQNKHLARVSKTPGRTQHINIFVLDKKRRLIDLPGYGYAKVPLAIKKKWQKTVEQYIQTRRSLRGLIMVMDIRHPLQPLDIQLLNDCQHRALPIHILLNKTDKLSKTAILKVTHTVKNHLTLLSNGTTSQSFSALKGSGMKELYFILDEWYNEGSKE